MFIIHNTHCYIIKSTLLKEVDDESKPESKAKENQKINTHNK